MFSLEFTSKLTLKRRLTQEISTRVQVLGDNVSGHSDPPRSLLTITGRRLLWSESAPSNSTIETSSPVS